MGNKEKYIIQDFLIQLEQNNYLDILKIITPFISYYVTNKVIDNYKLHRCYKPKNIKKVMLPPELIVEYNEIDVNQLASKKFGESLIKFVDKMVKNFSNEDLTNFYNNINTLKVSANKFKLENFIFGDSTAGVYDVRKNKIIIDEKYYNVTIFHELLHMASSVYKNGISYSGFNQSSLKSGITILGLGINEGYTELLSRRYFTEDNVTTNAYEYEVFLAKKLEIIVGKDKMQSLYLNANLSGLIQELAKYSSEQEVMELISNADFILEYLDNKKLKSLKKSMINNILKSINKFLIKSYSKKTLLQYQQNNITEEELSNKISFFVSILPSKFNFNDIPYLLLSDEEIKQCFESVFGELDVSVFRK